MRVRGTPLRLLAVLACSVALAAPVAAQVFTGRIDMAILDSTGAILPGVTVDLTGPQNQTAVSDAAGEVHFLNLAPGTYEVKATLSGFTDYVNRNVPVVAGGSVPLRVTLRPAGVAEEVEVTAESPVIDTKRQATGQNVTLDELQNIPSSRDPWVVMQTVPGVVVDRVNVGGAESGQQSNFIAKGSTRSEGTWNLDGISITDMAATGATSTYYDFDMFQEMSFTTGGADIQTATPGVQINFVMKQGSNTPHGSARYYFANEDLQSNNLSGELAALPGVGGRSGKGNRTDQNVDYGFELGGPILRDKLWAWGSVSRNDVRIRTLIDSLDRTVLKNYGLKAHYQATPGIRAGYTYFQGDKLKFGRGASSTRPDETTWNQSGPTHVNKAEGNFVIGNNIFLTGRYAHVASGFQLVPRGDFTKSIYQDDAGVFHGSWYLYRTERPQDSIAADANWFKGRHEVKFGFSYRKYSVDSLSQYPGTKFVSYHIGYPNILVQAWRDYAPKTEAKYGNFYIGDTISLDRLTLNVGARYDRSTSNVSATEAAGVPGIDLLPTLSVPGVEEGYEFNTLVPRLGVTYAIDESRKTQLRASYGMFASQLGAADAAFISPLQYAYVYYLAVDRNGNQTAELNEILFNLGLQGYSGFDPANPTQVDASVNRIDPDLKSPVTHEVVLGIDREVLPNFGLSGSFSWRRFNDVRWKPRVGVRSGDFRQSGTVQATLPDGTSVSVPFYALNAAAANPGREETNRDGYHQRYLGFEVSATKRMSNRWMARLGFSTNVHREYFTDPSQSIEDPTPSPAPTFSQPTRGPLVDGGVVVQQTGGSGKSQIFLILPKYQFIANGLYQGPWGVNFGANLVTRQGFGMPFNRSQVVTGDAVLNRKTVLLVQDLDENRLPAVTSFDVRIEKAFKFNRTNLIFDFDIFNVGNASTILGREYDARLTTFNNVREIMNPRIVRLGLRFNF